MSKSTASFKSCDECRGRMRCIDCRTKELDGQRYINRRYRCSACGGTITTAEFVTCKGRDRTRHKAMKFMEELRKQGAAIQLEKIRAALGDIQ